MGGLLLEEVGMGSGLQEGMLGCGRREGRGICGGWYAKGTEKIANNKKEYCLVAILKCSVYFIPYCQATMC